MNQMRNRGGYSVRGGRGGRGGRGAFSEREGRGGFANRGRQTNHALLRAAFVRSD